MVITPFPKKEKEWNRKKNWGKVVEINRLINFGHASEMGPCLTNCNFKLKTKVTLKFGKSLSIYNIINVLGATPNSSQDTENKMRDSVKPVWHICIFNINFLVFSSSFLFVFYFIFLSPCYHDSSPPGVFSENLWTASIIIIMRVNPKIWTILKIKKV